MTVADIPAVMALLSSGNGSALLEGETLEVYAKFIKRSPGGGYVAEDRGLIVACVFMSDGPRGLLSRLQVHPHYRGRRIGTRLVQAICQAFFRETDVNRVYAMVLSTNQKALSFWEAFGMRQSTASGGTTVAFVMDLAEQSWIRKDED